MRTMMGRAMAVALMAKREEMAQPLATSMAKSRGAPRPQPHDQYHAHGRDVAEIRSDV